MKKRSLLTLVFGLIIMPSVGLAESRSWHQGYRHTAPPGLQHKVPGPDKHYFGHTNWRPGPFWGSPGWFGNSHSSYRPAPFHSGSPSAWDTREIWRGVESGRLSAREVRDLRDRQEELQREYARYRADGYLSGSERRDLENDRNAFHKSLSHELNDGERR